MRRAVIILSSITLIFTLISLYLNGTYGNNNPLIEKYLDEGVLTTLLIMGALSAVGCVISIIGAVKFNFLLPVSIISFQI